jgi:hypothetical protein
MRHITPEIGHEVSQVVFFLQTDGAVRQEDGDILPRERADGVIRVDPRVHPFARTQLRPGRAKFGGDDVVAGLKVTEK